jgi:cell division septation protein DedD
MTSMLNLETSALPEVESRQAVGQDPVQQSVSATSTPDDYEIVLGRAQIASWLFVGVVAVAICSSLAYLAAEKITAQKLAAISTSISASAPRTPPVAVPADLPQASILPPPKADLAAFGNNPKTAAPLFAEPEMGKVYIQLAAVERGMATLLVEGLRNHGFDSFVAPGPNDKLFRVLIGPLPDAPAFHQAMVTVNALDLASFARKYQK